VVGKETKTGPAIPIGYLDDYGWFPDNVAATSSRHLVALSNQSTSSGAAGSVSIYLNRQTEPSRILTYAGGPIQGEGIAISHRGDCYWGFNGPESGSGSIVEFAGCNGSGTVVLSGIPKIGGIVFDQSDNLFYVNEVNSGNTHAGIYACKKTSNCSKNPLFDDHGGQPININFDHKAKLLWLADATGFIYAVSPKSGKSTQIQAYGAAPYGIAPAPGE
jgi:hypothetical protein